MFAKTIDKVFFVLYNVFVIIKEENIMAKTASDKTLDQVLLDIEKQFGKGAIMKLGEHDHQKIDVIFLDHMMPEMDGIATIKALNSTGYEIPPIVALTANNYDALNEIFEVPVNSPVREMLKGLFDKTIKTYYFRRRNSTGKVVSHDISSLDVSDTDEIVAEWGGLSAFSTRVSEVISKYMVDDEEEE